MAQKLNDKDLAFFNKANKTPYNTQAKLFLNAFWNDGVDALADEIWNFTQKFIQTDLFLKGLSPLSVDRAGTELDEHGFHVFLERTIKPLTVIEAREKLRQADVSFDGKVSLLEFLNWHFKKKADEFVKRAPEDPTDGDANVTPEMRKANAALAEVRKEILRIEMEKAKLEEESQASGIKGMKAKNELAQLLTADQTELNRALLTAEAAVRKVGGTGKDVPPGTLWWMNRELDEMKKYKAKAKQ